MGVVNIKDNKRYALPAIRNQLIVREGTFFEEFMIGLELVFVLLFHLVLQLCEYLF